MDRVTRSYLDQFRVEQSLGAALPEADLFEHFADYCVVSNQYEEEFDLADVHTGSADDLGIDGVAIIVNGVIVSSVDEAEDLLRANNFLDVKFIFVQAKTTSGFDGTQMMNFLDGVDEFFADPPTIRANDKVENARAIMTWLYDRSVKFTRQKPVIHVAFVTTGHWQEDEKLVAKVDVRKTRLKDSGLFHEIEFEPMGADAVHAAYQRSKNNVSVEFTFANKVLLPDIAGVSQAYLGVLPAKEYLALITDSVGNIRKPLFYDNVRDFQGTNAVNREIRKTLQDTEGQQRFAVLNNGVTVVTRSLRTTGNKFVVSDYQIVNGCQTSHVLFDVYEELGDEAYVPLKVISTEDEDIISAIITATNRQTEVTADDLYAMSAFQKRLEAFYDAFPDKKKLHYERRSKQYASVQGVEKVRIIGKNLQVRAFAAMFLDDPHRAARYYSDLRAQVGTRIFADNHKLEPYYVSAYAYYKLEFLWRNNLLPVYYKPARYHLLMAVRHLVGGKGMPALTANRVSSYANYIAEWLWSDDRAQETFKESVEVIDMALNGAPLGRDIVKTQGFTDAVKAAAAEKVAAGTH